ncbi:ATP-binding protein [Streptomyces griseocarneus]|uniref:ATP-binding protein n=1 Tax=Streptomyces griseocarneus TaxID=51201 RepID=UPI00167D3D62|nr:ATP-binding protein [Streptomyces griseocarneus]MBZ6474792.1 ATP-binding protein [Streptomyces griseocarneus]
MSPTHTADAITSAPDALADRAFGPQRLLGPWGQGLVSCSHSAPGPWPARTPGAHPSGTVTLPSSTRSVAAARRFAGALLAEWGLQDLVGDAVLLLSELVTNAVVHVPEGAGEVKLVLRRTAEHLVAQVSDAGGCLPECAEAGPDSENGRGMWLVEQIAARWGHHATGSGTGKTVWFALCLPAATPVE